MRVERIDDPADPRLDDYRDLRAADHRRRGLFVAESLTVVRRLLGAGRYRARSILATGPALAALGDVAAPPALPAYTASSALVRQVVGFRFHRGALAIGERGCETLSAEVIDPPGRRLLLALEDLADPDNVGAAFRSAVAFGVDGVLVSPAAADPLYRKAIRTSMGATLGLPWARPADWARALEELRRADYRLLGLTPDPAAPALGDLLGRERLPARLALVVGAEGQGLGTGTLAVAQSVRIPMEPGVDSLNAAAACAVALHRLYEERR